MRIDCVDRCCVATFADGAFATSERGRGVTATLCRTDRTSDLLHVLAWASVLPFTRDSVRSGVFTWGWLMAARPAAERDARRVLLGV
jgi:hypothetical protein